ncbi:DUF2306 domain-containing protein [Spirosoma validum]|uniref:DUF2306 domain-containing protein n=1 Tax=Spirosoma validum TaxID=2771355 RepID=A0A927B7X4_9BACT|nr:DUF2306 domain-containing protein [Spirosoma validum]MBD2756792.1 DUF2306 domain-containing protein [Spirosoma validum]
MIHSTLGLFHFISALLAMLSGAVVITKPKGGLFHRRIGYIYVSSMLLLNLTAFQIYHLFGRFGPFHALAIVSLFCLIGGIVPALLRQRIKNWIHWHYYFMNWSIVGLYAAFWAELFTRTLPINQFWPIVLVASSITSWIGAYFIRKHAPRLLALRK